MTREQAKELLPVIQAYADGKTVQCRRVGTCWADTNQVGFGFGYNGVEYRVKPEPREWWIVTSALHSPVVYQTEAGAQDFVKAYTGCSIIHVREVVEE